MLASAGLQMSCVRRAILCLSVKWQSEISLFEKWTGFFDLEGPSLFYEIHIHHSWVKGGVLNNDFIIWLKET